MHPEAFHRLFLSGFNATMCRSFVHLHNHTEYSLLDGANRIPQMVGRAKELGMPALAITDHGVMFGAMEFYFECKKQGIKPIIGLEAYVAPEGVGKKPAKRKSSYHLLLLAKNEIGYRNLCKLATVGALQGFYNNRPHIDHELLRQHSEGLVSSTTCLSSEICSALLEGEYDRAQYIAGMYKEIFGAENFFVELQNHRLEPQQRIEPQLLRIAKEINVPVVATNDAHYLCKDSHKAHDVLLCIQTGALVGDKDRMRFETDEFYIKSQEEMAEVFAHIPEAIENSGLIADLVNLELGSRRAAMPEPELPEGKDSASHLRELVFESIQKLVPTADERYAERLEYELSVIEKTHFEDYFLLVREFAAVTREKKIEFGVRGSAAGSLVAFSLGITEVDPIEYDLTFERFLNPERVAMPDIDMDFEDARRDEIIKWVSERYGQDHVAQIITFGTLGAKAALKDCARVMGWPPSKADKLAKAVPATPGITLAQAEKESPEFKKLLNEDPESRMLFELAQSVEGISRHTGVHAAGVVISKDPIQEHVPLYRGTDGQPVTAYEMGILEKLNMLKMDFLGLSNLTVIARTVDAVNQRLNEEFDIRKIPLDDDKTFRMLSGGETTGVFQLESAGMRRYVAELKPTSIRELAAMIALYRPGPLNHIPTYISNKFGKTKPQFLDDRMKPILEETYGVIVYQDQVLKLVQALAGFSLGKADLLRRAMGKKDKDAMKALAKDFFAGTEQNGMPKDKAEKVWELLLPFAGYAFNKAHAVCYAFLAYRTAYLKAHYPAEYMAALLDAYRSREDKVVAFVEQARKMGIRVLPPDINSSEAGFVVRDGSIQFGLTAIRGVGDGLVQAIIRSRNSEDGTFVHLFEFATRLKPSGLSKNSMESLIKSGALDSIEVNRARTLEAHEAALVYADRITKSRDAGQDSLFVEEGTTKAQYPSLPEIPDLPRMERLASEKEVLGVYVSDHPLRGYEAFLRRSISHRCANIEEVPEGTQVNLAGILVNVRTQVRKTTKEMWAQIAVEDLTGIATLLAFPKTYEKYRQYLVKDSIVKLKGVVVHSQFQGESRIEVRLEHIEPLQLNEDELEAPEFDTPKLALQIRRAGRDDLKRLEKLAARHVGIHRLVIRIETDTGVQEVPTRYLVEPSADFRDNLLGVFPDAAVEIEAVRAAY